MCEVCGGVAWGCGGTTWVVGVLWVVVVLCGLWWYYVGCDGTVRGTGKGFVVLCGVWWYCVGCGGTTWIVVVVLGGVLVVLGVVW